MSIAIGWITAPVLGLHAPMLDALRAGLLRASAGSGGAHHGQPARGPAADEAGEEAEAASPEGGAPSDGEGDEEGDEPVDEGERSTPSEQPPLGTTRRRFLAGLAGLFGGGIGALVTVPVIGFLFWPLFREEPPTWRGVGTPEDFDVDEMIAVSFGDPSPIRWAGVTAESAAYIRRLDDDQFVAFSIYCTHQGCQVRWLPEGRLFMCPCHGGVFHQDGSVAAGPPPRPLVRHPVRVREGIVEIQTRPLPVGEGALIEDEIDELEDEPR